MYTNGNYFPSVWEFIVSIGLISIGCLIYCFIVENFKVIGDEYAVQVRVQNANNSGLQVWSSSAQQVFEDKK